MKATFAAMFRRILAITILTALISSNFSKFFVYAGFGLNQKYIAETLCINKSRPWLHCNGRCYFMKKIKQAEDDDRKQEAKNNLTRLEVTFLEQPYSIAFIEPALLTTHTPKARCYNYRYISKYISTIFRPPKLAA